MADEPEEKSGTPSSPPEEKEKTRSRMIDVQGMIRQASRRVSVDDLVKKGRKTISMLSREKIDELINQAVKNIADKYRAMAAGVTQVPVEQIQAESKDEFNELLHQYQETTKAKTELETSRASLDQELDELRKDLERQKALAEGRLSEDAEKTLLVGFKEFERELDRITARVFEKRKLIIENNESPEAAAELKQIEEVLRKIIAKLVAVERERFAMAGGRDREIAFLEKRIEKLYEQMTSMETALRTISNSKLYSNQQIQNVLRQLGLGQEDQNYEKKREMLKIVLQSNKDLRTKAKDMEEKGVTLASPGGNVDAPTS